MRVYRSIPSVAIVALAGGMTLPACKQLPLEDTVDWAGSNVQSSQTRFSRVIPQFAQALPLPSTSGGGMHTVFGNRPLTLRMCEFWANVLPPGTFEQGSQPKTRVWGYIEGDSCPPNGPSDPAVDTYIGPVIVSDRATPKEENGYDERTDDDKTYGRNETYGRDETYGEQTFEETTYEDTFDAKKVSLVHREPNRKKGKGRKSRSTDVTWVNELGNAADTGVLAYRFSTDQTLHWADPLNKEANACAELARQGVVPAPGSACAQNYAGSIPAVVHLHGGEVPAEIDGGPEAWFTSNGVFKGPAFYTFTGDMEDEECDEHRHDSRHSKEGPSNRALYRYPNVQQAAPLWFHDHTLGTTRLNVHAGLAGAYFIEDPGIIPKGSTTTSGTPGTCRSDCLPANLPPLAQVVPLVLQDRIFDTQGQFFFPADTAGGENFRVNPQHPYWVPEFIGDTIVVNGKAWPFVQVEAKRVQFMILNGSNARPYELSIPNGPPMYVIATDGGYLDRPVEVSAARPLLMQPGERYEVIVDFANFANQNLILRNTARTPLPGGDSPVGTPLEQIIQFKVGSPPTGGDASYNPVSGIPLRTGKNELVRLVDPTAGALAPGVLAEKRRQLTLNEVIQAPSIATDPVTGAPNTPFPGGPFEILLNNTSYEGTKRQDFTPITIGRPGERVTKFVSELPQEGDTEVWEIVNLTADAHPIHLHLVQFQLMNRQDFDTTGYSAVYNAAFASGSFTPGFGPPLNYGPSSASGGKLGGNPDVTPFLVPGTTTPPQPYEAGWKDTVIMFPNQVTRIAVRWAPTDIGTTAKRARLHYPFDPTDNRGYVWHCHILDHEDNEMMRPYNVKLNRAAPRPKDRPLVKGSQY